MLPLPRESHKTPVVVVLADSIVALDLNQGQVITDYIDPLLIRLSESTHPQRVSRCALAFWFIFTYHHVSLPLWHPSLTVPFIAMALPSRSPNSCLLTPNIN